MSIDHRHITICTDIAPISGKPAAAVYRPDCAWQSRFAPRHADGRECSLMGQTPIERLSQCIRTHYPDAIIHIINRAPWE